MLLILFFILVLNIVAIVLTYYCLSNLEQKEKIISIAIGVAVIYMLTSFVYWISTKGVEIKAVSEMGKNLITFLFVPINGIIILPMLAKSYAKYKNGELDLNRLKNRGLVLGVVLVILLVLECMYFKDIQNSVVTIVERNRQEQQKEENDDDIVNYLQDGQAEDLSNVLSNEQADKQLDAINENAISNDMNENSREVSENVVSTDL